MPQLEIALPSKEQIEKRAYEPYLARGCEPGKEVEDWLTAEKQLTVEKQFTGAGKPTQAKKAKRANAGSVSVYRE
jgi:hypothetical protein